MGSATLLRLAAGLGLLSALALFAPALAPCDTEGASVRAGAPSRGASDAAEISDTTWVDHDRHPIPQPPDWQPSYWGRRFHQGLVEPVSHIFDIPDKLLYMARALGSRTQREAANVNALDEVPNSAWFTNRNHMRAVPVSELRRGPASVSLPAKPWTIKHAKQGGWSSGFQIKDADGRKWLVKLDPRGHPQLSSGADMVARTLLHAAGYNVPHNEPVRFRRGDVAIDADLLRGAEGEQFSDADLDSILAQGAIFPDGSYAASASLFIPGHALGSPSMNRLRPGDANDWYTHTNRRELRGLFVLCSWINNWDTEDHQFLDMFVEGRDSLGHVQHYILDAGSSFGASATGPKRLSESYENGLDFAWTARRFVTLGFVNEPWRRAHQETGIPSVGNYESEVYRPERFRQLVPQPAFRKMTDRDGYWGAKIVASFSDAQIAAAVEAAHYEDPRATDYLVRNLILRRDKIARHWFGRVAPLDFFSVQEGALRFHDLAVDVGMVGARAYDIEVESEGGRSPGGEHLRLSSTEVPLTTLGIDASRVSLEISIAGNRAEPVHVELTRRDSVWFVTRVRHG
jgi:hypothetical protein